MFKYHKEFYQTQLITCFPPTITDIIIIQDKQMTYKQIQGRGKMFKLFSFHGVRIWNHISKKIQIDVSYACFKNLSKTYLLNNEIPQRIR